MGKLLSFIILIFAFIGCSKNNDIIYDDIDIYGGWKIEQIEMTYVKDSLGNYNLYDSINNERYTYITFNENSEGEITKDSIIYNFEYNIIDYIISMSIYYPVSRPLEKWKIVKIDRDFIRVENLKYLIDDALSNQIVEDSLKYKIITIRTLEKDY